MKKTWLVIGTTVALVGVFILIGWSRSRRTGVQTILPIPTSVVTENESFALQSSAFAAGRAIPVVYTCDGSNTRPPLTISGVPQDTKSLAIVMYDPDAPGGTFVHWVAWNIPPETQELPHGSLLPTIMEGTTSYQSVGYQGPCPPSGTHRYVWRLYALRSVLSLDSKATREDLETAINTYVITQTELLGMYTKQ